jgi:hypothetical protein
MEFFGIRLLGLTTANAHKLLLTLVFIVLMLGLRWAVAVGTRCLVPSGHQE